MIYKLTSQFQLWNQRRSRVLPASVVFMFCILPLSLFSEETLSEDSPFLPPGYGEEEKKPERPVIQPQGPISREIEFRGIVKMDGEYQVSLYNKKEQRGYWMKESETEDGISVRGYDAESSTIVISMNGRSEQLTLMEATDSPMPVAKTRPQSGNQARTPTSPPQANQSKSNSENRRKVVPRRRVILPKK